MRDQIGTIGGDGRRLVSIMQAMAVAGVSRRTIYNWLYAGKLEAVRTAGGNIRIYLDTLFIPLGAVEKTP